jgi:hypothetical protein
MFDDWDHVITTVNDVGVKSSYGGGGVTQLKAQWGVCAAMSAIWLKKMFSMRDIMCAPDMVAAGALYAKWANRQDGQGLSSEQFNLGLVQNAGLDSDTVQSFSAASAVLRMGTMTGAYYISTGNHAMAAVTGPSGYYFFDPNGGAWKTLLSGKFDEVKTHIESAYAGQGGYASSWVLIKVSNGA